MKTKCWIIAIVLCMAVSTLLLSSLAAAKPYDTLSLDNIEALSMGEPAVVECYGNGSIECPGSYAKVKVY